MIISRKKFERLVEERLREERGMTIDIGEYVCFDRDVVLADPSKDIMNELLVQLGQALDAAGAVVWEYSHDRRTDEYKLGYRIRVVLPGTKAKKNG